MQLRLLLPVISLALASAFSQSTSAQTGNVGIGTTTPLARLHVADSAVLFTGSNLVTETTPFNPPASGTGTRMMWYPQKAAFRAGGVQASQWNKNNIGIFSFAAGFNTIAIGKYSASMGDRTTASGEASTSMGGLTTASGDRSISMGFSTKAIGINAVSMGGTTTASGNSSVSMGTGTVARAYASVALGLFNDSVATADPTSSVATDPVFIIGNGSGFTTRRNAMTVLKNGNVGVNTISPAAKIHVVRSTPSDGLVNTSAALILEDSTGSLLQFLSNSTYQSGIISATEKTTLRSGILFPGDSSIAFRSGGNNTKMTLEANGNVGIGTLTPTQKLHVIGNILASGTITPSDLRYKKDIEVIDHPLEKIDEIRGVTYKMKADEFPENGFTDEAQAGVIAQEVESVLPQVVVTDQNGYKAVDYSKMVPLLIEGIKELKKQTEELKKESEYHKIMGQEFKKQNESLQKRIENLERK
jgi:hypothetical protein